MSFISVNNLTFAYDGSYDNIFERVSFHIDTDWRLGFTGRNGRGKTTFLQLLMGKYSYQGNISASVDFEYFPFTVPDKTLNTLAILEAINPDFLQWQLERELSLLEVDLGVLYRPFDSLSNGEQTKVLLATLFLKENSFLLIDEPTNHLDVLGRQTVERYLQGKSGFILVSHDRSFLDNCVDHILSINRANIEVQRGNFSSWWENKQRQDAYELAENERLQKDVKRLKQAARQSSEWADKAEATKIGFNPQTTEKMNGLRAYVGEKSRRMQQRRKNLERRQTAAIEEKSTLLKNLEETETLKITPLSHHAKNLILLDDISIQYGDTPVCQGVNFSLSQGEAVALKGQNGSGKSSLIKLIMGQDVPCSGSLTLPKGLVISYVPQDTGDLQGDLRTYAESWDIDESLFKAILRKLDFSRVQFEKNIEQFSAGQKKKVLLARSLCQKAHLYIWDEPLNYIDVFSRMQIEALLLKFKPTLLFVEHDRTFCHNIATKIVQL